MGDSKILAFEPAGVMARLKAETAGQHQAAESRPFQRRLVMGRVTIAEYGRWLAEMLVVHHALESRLRKAAAADARIASVVTSEQYHENGLRADLVDLAVPPSTTPVPGGAALVDRISRVAPLHLLGMHYVLEGSTNGNRFIARAIRKALAIAPGQGDRYLDPYGDDQREKWTAFRVAMDRIPWSAADADAIVAGAVTMFDGVTSISRDLESGQLV